MNINFSNYLDQLITVKHSKEDESIPTSKSTKKRWILDKNKIEYVCNPHSTQQQNMGTIYSIMNKHLKEFKSQAIAIHNEEESKELIEKLNLYKTIVLEKASHFEKRHGRIFKLFYNLFYGNISRLSQEIASEIDGLKQDVAYASRIKTDKKFEIIPISFVKKEKNRAIRSEANRIIEIMQNGSNLLIHEGIDFKMIQKLKEAKKDAKNILNTPKISADTRTAMEQVINQYNNIVQAVEVLSILREISQEIRKKKIQEGFAWDSPTAIKRFANLLKCSAASDDRAVHTLISAYKTDKIAWKKNWTSIRQNIWNTSIESHSFLKEDNKITFITGSKSSSVPIILRTGDLAPKLSPTPTLAPTGLLIQHHIVPLAGELEIGISQRGVNQTSLSGMRFAGLDTCIGYASNKAFQFNAEQELKILTGEEQAFDNFLPRLHVAALRLLRMGAKKEAYQEIKDYLNSLIQKEPQSTSMASDWSTQAGLIGQLCQTTGENPKNELQRGQVVAVPRTGFSSPKYGIIAEKNEAGSYRVIVEKDGTSKNIDPKDITIVSKDVLDNEIKKHSPLNEEEKIALEKRLLNRREQLEHILKLFNTDGLIEPFDFTPSDLNLIENPFPIVWASVSTSQELKVEAFRNGVEGEHIIHGKAVLGKDIQLVFTHRENVNTLQSLVKNQGVKVLSFEAAYYILGRDMESKYRFLWD